MKTLFELARAAEHRTIPKAPCFECELPPLVRQELFKPKRREKKTLLYRTLKYLLCVAAGCIAVLMVRPVSFYQREAVSKNREIIQRTIADTGAQLAPTPTVITQAPKAELIKLPAWRIGETRALQMRYGEIVNATLRGQVDSYNQLPRRGQLGDLWMVAGTPWVWTHPAGSAFTTWIDP